MDFENQEIEKNKEIEEVPKKQDNDEKPKFNVPEWVPVRDVDEGDWDF